MTVEKSDLEAKLKEIQSIVDETGEQAKGAGVIIAAVAVTLLLLFFLAGRRKGRKGSARVEVYRLG